EQKAASLDTEVVKLRALAKEIPADKQKLQVLDSAVPDNPDLSDALAELHGIAQATGVTLSSVGPSPQSTTSGGASSATPSINLSMSLTGSYPETIAFMKDLVDPAHMPRTTVIQHVSVAADSGSLSTNLIAQ